MRPAASSSPAGSPAPAPPADPSLLDAAEVLESLGTGPAAGLSSAEAAERLAQAGRNRLDPAAEMPAWRKLLAQFADPLIYLLLAAIVISVVAWALEGAQGVPFEAIVIAVIVAANGVLGFVQERKAEQAVAALQRMAAPAATVVRDGTQVRIPAEELVPGDILLLGEGDAVGADGRLLQVASLQMAESALTGESEPVLKDGATLPAPAPLGDRTNMVFSGTSVTRGPGPGGGDRDRHGHRDGPHRRPARAHHRGTHPAATRDRPGRLVLGIAVIVIAVVVVAAILLTSDIREAGDLVEVLLLGVSLAVAAVPEGLPAVLSVVLALGVQRMARQHAIVKKLSSVETLGSASVICSDKTGTLTKNEMTIQRVVTRSGEAAVTGIGYRPRASCGSATGHPTTGPCWRRSGPCWAGAAWPTTPSWSSGTASGRSRATRPTRRSRWPSASSASPSRAAPASAGWGRCRSPQSAS
jgi:magnesium-transporting ATPase (P-type)